VARGLLDQGDFVREDAIDTCNRRYVLYKYSQEEAFRQSGEYCHEMLSGKQVVKWMLSDNLENAVRKTSSQTVASISLKNIVREGNQHDYDVREDTSLKGQCHEIFDFWFFS
jgi:hypothetical protein